MDGHIVTAYERIQEQLRAQPRTWVVTGCAGFIGSHLLQALLELQQRVVGLDDFSTGTRQNLVEVERDVPVSAWKHFRLIEGSILDIQACRDACRDADFVLHQAAFVSVPMSVADPIRCNQINVDGFLNMLLAARDARVKGFVYASSSAVYGDDPALPKSEEHRCRPVSPYGVSKLVDELYATVLCDDFSCAGLRYFNIFGPRQNPAGGYAAVIPKWTDALIRGEECVVFGDGSATRDFCHISNVIQANILAATAGKAGHEIYNVGLGRRTDLNTLYKIIAGAVGTLAGRRQPEQPRYEKPRAGDILHSESSIEKIERQLGYEPIGTFEEHLKSTVGWYIEHAADGAATARQRSGVPHNILP